MTKSGSTQLDHATRGTGALKKLDPDRHVEPWSPGKQRRSETLGGAWASWLSAERERRGKPNWTPFWW